MSGVATAIAGAAIVGAFASNKASDKASAATKLASDTASAEVRRSVEQARQEINPIFQSAGQAAQQGFQGALDVFGQSLPQQASLFQGGNVAAQQQLLAGLPQIQNAILGGNVDLSGLQPFQAQQPDFSFANQQIPQFGFQQPEAATTNTNLPQSLFALGGQKAQPEGTQGPNFSSIFNRVRF